MFETKWWHQKRIFSEFDAITDLYQSADKKSTISVSVRSLADRWLWDHTKVSRFLARLAAEGYIETLKSIGGTTIKIVDFGATATRETEKCNTEPRINTLFPECQCNTSDVADATPQPISQRRFVKPTIQQIDQYCNEKGYSIDAESFWNFYESKGWVVGKSPMKNWKAACTTWNKKRNSTGLDNMRLRNNNTNKFEKKFSW